MGTIGAPLVKTVKRWIGIRGLQACLLAGLWCLIIAPVRAEDQVVLQLRWTHQFQFAGFYAAQWQGYYEAEDLDVEVRSRVTEDGTFLDIFEEVSSERADFSLGGADILVNNDQGGDFVVLATILQQSPNAFYALSDETLSQPADFLRHPVALLENDFDSLELFALLVAEGLDPAGVERRPYEPGLVPLLRGDFAITPAYRFSLEWRARELGLDLARLAPSDFGVRFYGDTLFTRHSLVERRPDMVERFVRASLRGWAYALEQPREIAERIVAELPQQIRYADPLGYNPYSAEIMHHLSGYPLVDLGHTSPARWRVIHELLADAGFLQGPLNVDSLIGRPSQLTTERLQYWLTVSGIALAIGGALAGAGFAALHILRRKVATATRELQGAQRNVQETLNLLRALFDTIPDSISVKDEHSCILMANKPMPAGFGLTTETIVGKATEDLFGPQVAAAMTAVDPPLMGNVADHLAHRGHARLLDDDMVLAKAAAEIVDGRRHHRAAYG